MIVKSVSNEFLVFLAVNLNFPALADPATQFMQKHADELIGYHWHPVGRGTESIPDPHLHVYAETTRLAGKYLSKLHLLTGHMPLADVVKLLLTDFDVRPRRADWPAVLAGSREPFGA